MPIAEPERYRHYVRFLAAVDPLADAAAASFADGSASNGRKMLETALNAGIAAVANPSPALVELFKQLDAVPIWVDWDRIDKGGAVLLRSGALGVAVLNLFSLPIMYSSAGGTKPLVFTGDLLRRAPRRLAETARFVLSSSRPGGLRRFSDGFKITVRVRLMHAQVRRLLLRSGKWKPEWGQPVNQLYMAGTNVALSAGVLEGLQRLGFRFSSADEEALLHMWRYSGYLSGVDPELLVSTRDEGRIIGELIRDGEGPPDADSRALVVALMTAAYHPMLEGAKWPAKISYAISRKLIGDPLADALGYPPSLWNWTLTAARPFFAAGGMAQRLPGARGLATKVGARIWDMMIEQVMAGAQVEFRPPTKLENAPREKQG
jgi:ER-bound oxygenase mpaB/B'/Rubber oxygenase, catalytic domain